MIETIETILKISVFSYVLTYSLWYIGSALDFVFSKIFKRHLNEF
jgi:hypothetical protein